VTASTPAALLAEALARDPARPLLTFHDHATGERTELSVATFANWVAKTANLLRDELDLPPGARVRVDLPLHWQAAVWLQACWALGLEAVDDPGRVDCAVVTHEQEPADAGEVVSLGLGPMGLPRPGSSPAYAGALDYDREVHGHGDRFTPAVPPAAGDPALALAGSRLTAGQLAAAAVAGPRPGGGLLVTEPLTTLPAVLAGLLVPLATGVTGVLVRHPDPTRLAGLVAQEQLAAALGGQGAATSALPAWRPTTWA
jgi:uncharacterized protein (TIGR03089 family)